MSALPDPQLDTLEFYRKQLELSFRCSRLLGAAAEPIVDTPECQMILRECAPGSLDCARRLGERVIVLLDRAVDSPWWRDLLNYERAWFMQAATTLEGPPTNRPRRGVSAMCLNFGWNVPELVKRLQAEQPATDGLRTPVTLVFARGAEGRVFVAQVSPEIEKVFRATNGLRTADQIALVAGIGVDQAKQILSSLASIGAIVPAMSSDEMMRLIEKSERK